MDEQNPSILPIRRTVSSLPSLKDFDKGVDRLVQVYGLAGRLSLPNQAQTPTIVGPLQAFTQGQFWLSQKGQVAGSLVNEYYRHDPGSDSHAHPHVQTENCEEHFWQHGHPGRVGSSSGDVASQNLQISATRSYCRSPVWQNQKRQQSQRYSIEEGDFIIYAFVDRNMSWEEVEHEFHDRFGYVPKRTVPGLQAWFYRMNKRIPTWDQDGWLCFDHEDQLEPRYTSIKCRDHSNCDKSLKLPGIAERYPERAVKYKWIDSELKLWAQDWGRCRSL